MKRFTLISLVSLILVSSAQAYSTFNSRGLGSYMAAPEYVQVLPRNMTRFGGNFLFEYNYATDGEANTDAFLVKPQDFHFFFQLPARFGLSLNLQQRYNMDFSVQSDSATSGDFYLVQSVKSRGGVSGLRIGLDKSFFDIIYIGAGYERYFGGSWERWESEIIDIPVDTLAGSKTTVDSLLYHYKGNGLWGMLGVNVGPVQLRGHYGFPLGLDIRTEVQTTRDTSTIDSASYDLPAEFGGILSYSFADIDLSLAYLQLTGGDQSLGFIPGMLVELNSAWKLEPFTLTAGAGYHKWNVQTVNSSDISDIYLKIGSRIPIEEYGFGILELKGGLRSGADISEYHVELRAGMEFGEIWKRRERMWGG